MAPRFRGLAVGRVRAFGRHGPDAMLAGMDLVVQARTGLMASLGKVEDGVPASGEAPVADYICALSLAFGIAGALLRRERTGRGGEVSAALMMAALVAQNNSMVRVESVDGPVHAAEWKPIFDARGVPGAAVRFPTELFDDEQALANGFFHDLPHPALGPVRVLAPPVKMDGDGFQPGAPTPPFASQTRAILGELGFDGAQIEALLAAKV